MSKPGVLRKVRRHQRSHQELWRRLTAAIVLVAALVVAGFVVMTLLSTH